jgi:hypothetical protein
MQLHLREAAMLIQSLSQLTESCKAQLFGDLNDQGFGDTNCCRRALQQSVLSGRPPVQQCKQCPHFQRG